MYVCVCLRVCVSMNAYLTQDPLYRQFRPRVGTHPQLRRRRGYRLLYSSNIVLCVLIHDKCCKAEVCNNECDRFHIVFILFNFFIWEKVTSFLYFFSNHTFLVVIVSKLFVLYDLYKPVPANPCESEVTIS